MADSVVIEDVDVVFEVAEKFGIWGLGALLVHARQQEPQKPMLKLILENDAENYYKALDWLKENHPDLRDRQPQADPAIDTTDIAVSSAVNKTLERL